jgi:hypothetical protein
MFLNAQFLPQLFTTLYFKLSENAFDMLLHGSRADGKVLCDFAGSESTCEQGARFGFA